MPAPCRCCTSALRTTRCAPPSTVARCWRAHRSKAATSCTRGSSWAPLFGTYSLAPPGCACFTDHATPDAVVQRTRAALAVLPPERFPAVTGNVEAVLKGVVDHEVFYGGPAEGLRDVWLTLQAAVRGILDSVTLADLVRGAVPASS